MADDDKFGFFRPEDRSFITAVADRNLPEALARAAKLPGGVNVTGSGGETALLVAVSGLDDEMVSGLLKAGALPDGGKARAPLYVAIRAEELTVARLLLSAGANPNGRAGSRTALHEAALMGANPAIKLLLSAGADINSTDAVGDTPLLLAAASDNWSTVDLLIDLGALANATTSELETLNYYVANSRLLPTSQEGKALSLVGKKLRTSLLP